MNKESTSYRSLCTEFYELDKSHAPEDALQCYLQYAKEAKGPILEPMCGTGRFFIPFLEHGYTISGFDSSPFMLNVCREKCRKLGATSTLAEATFETFRPSEKYNLIFIPSGSFCHLITDKEINNALSFITEHLKPGSKFAFEIETLNAVREPQGIWRAKWMNRLDGSKIVMNVLSHFDKNTRIETGLFRYELWEENKISRTEVEDYKVRHYDPHEIELLLSHYNLKVVGKWQTEPHAKIEAKDDAAVILYECIKD